MTERISSRMKAALMGGFLFVLLLAVGALVAGQTGGSCWGVAHHEGRFYGDDVIWGGILTPDGVYATAFCGCSDGQHALVTVRFVGAQSSRAAKPSATRTVTVYWLEIPLWSNMLVAEDKPWTESEYVRHEELVLGGGITVWATWVYVDCPSAAYGPFGEYTISYFLPIPRPAGLVGGES